MEKLHSLSLCMQGKPQLFPTVCFFPVCLLYFVTHNTSDISGHQMSGGLTAHQAILWNTSWVSHHSTQF